MKVEVKRISNGDHYVAEHIEKMKFCVRRNITKQEDCHGFITALSGRDGTPEYPGQAAYIDESNNELYIYVRSHQNETI